MKAHDKKIVDLEVEYSEKIPLLLGRKELADVLGQSSEFTTRLMKHPKFPKIYNGSRELAIYRELDEFFKSIRGEEI